MKRVCAWCSRELDEVYRREAPEVTHGVCQECRRRHFASAGAKEAGPRLPVPNDVAGDAGRPSEPTSLLSHL